jgi:hypothetical protein
MEQVFQTTHIITVISMMLTLTSIGVGYVAYTGRFLMFSVITNIYNKKIKGPTLPHTRQHVEACMART